MLTLNHVVTTGDTYAQVYRKLCANIIANTDTTILNETDGLDVYPEVFQVVTATVTALDGTAAFTTATDKINIVYGFKKKSSPSCS
jgi:hypothetical protein